MTPEQQPDPELLRLLGPQGATARPRRHRGLWLLLPAAAVGAALLLREGGDPAPAWRTAAAALGDLTLTVTATGTLQPVDQVDVGSELSGTIDTVAVDFNDRVTRGQELARLDTDILEARIAEARAALASARAKVEEARASTGEAQANLRRCEELAARQMCPRHDLDAARAAFARAQAGEAMARAQTGMAEAALAVHETNRTKAVLRAPIDGIVLNRQARPGQTVTASFQTPVLFTLAEDLTRMELLAAVDEADVGQVREGQEATFTVDAYPGRTFPARITQVRWASQTVENVVTYQAELAVDNRELLLRPGMTATAEVTVARRTGVLRVPNAALRFSPPAARAERSGGLLGGLFGRPAGERRRAEGKGPRVYLLRDGVPVALPLTLGAGDGEMTEVTSGELTPGTALLVDVAGAGR